MDEKTLATYNQSAPKLAEYFRGIGSRIDDIDKAIEIRNKSSGLRVLELGCGDGRDGAEIAKRAEYYLGIDYSEGMIGQAVLGNPSIDFRVADMEDFLFPRDVDIIYAFASLLHLDKEGVRQIFRKSYFSLADEGVIYISTKTAESYAVGVQADQYGERIFYYYSPEELVELAKPFFKVVHLTTSVKGSTEWVEIAFQKRRGKLVRDLIPELIRSNNETPEVIQLTEDEFRLATDDKVVEEALELRGAMTPEQKLEEPADVDELTDAELKILRKTREDLERAKQAKAEKRGAFAVRYYLFNND